MKLPCLLFPAVILLIAGAARPVWADDEAPATEPAPLRRIDGIMIRTIDPVDPEAWERFSDKQQSANVAGLKKFAADAMTVSHDRFTLIESPHFLVYAAYLDAGQTAKDAVYLENCYTVASHIFDLKAPMGLKDKSQGLNLWRGKAVYFIFDGGHTSDAERFEFKLHHAKISDEDTKLLDRQSVWAIATFNGNGSVDVVATTRPGFDLRPLARAMTAGFIYRLHSPKSVAPWVEDGLAYGVAGSVNSSGNSDARYAQSRQKGIDQDARNGLAHADLDDCLNHFDPDKSNPGLFDDFTLFMYKQSSPRFLAFVLGMKDGLSWEESVNTKYGMDKDRLESAYVAMLKSSGK